MRVVSFLVLILAISCNKPSNIALKPDAEKVATLDSVTIIKDFFTDYESDPQSALDSLFVSNSNITDTAQTDFLKTELNSRTSQLGKYYGYDLITCNSISPNYMLRSYIVYYELQPIRFNIILYRLPGKDWKVQNFAVDGTLQDELKETGKVYFMNKIYN